jgi:hypothetical protein
VGVHKFRVAMELKLERLRVETQRVNSVFKVTKGRINMGTTTSF